MNEESRVVSGEWRVEYVLNSQNVSSTHNSLLTTRHSGGCTC